MLLILPYDAFHQSFFYVTSIISTTGFGLTDVNKWPELSKTVIIILTFIGASAGSTGGGFKISRIILLFKEVRKEFSLLVHPRNVKLVKMDGRDMYAYHFDGYWKDVGTITSLWEANMEVLDPEHSGINLFDDDWRIYSRNSGMTGHRIGTHAVIENSMITDGCRVDGQVKHSILFAGVKVERGAVIEDAVIMGGTVVAAGAVVKHCIVAENVTIGRNAVVGAMPTETEQGVATIGSDVVIGKGAKISCNAMVSEDVKEGEEV